MKVIHTSDWHIGQTLYQYSRDEEHKYFFKQLKDIVLEEIKDISITLKKSEDCYKLCLSAEFLQANSLDGYLYFGIMISNYNSVSQREMLLLSSSIDPRQWFDPVYFEKLVLE